jgi:hypothetical protein
MRIDRLEIPKPVKLQVFKRAGGPGNVRCEGCTLRLGGKPFEYHHCRAEWTQNVPISERDPIIAADVKLLCIPCHDEISAKDTTARAHGKRIIARAARANPARTPMKCGRNSPYKRKMNGQLVWRETGEPVR